MAKRKKSVALFEVIHADKRFAKKEQPASPLRTPLWWFKKSKTIEPEVVAGVVPPPPKREIPKPAAAPVDEFDAAVAERAVAKPIDYAVDPDRQIISFKLTYTTAAIGGFALLVIVILSFIIGRHLRHGSSPVLSGVTTEDLRAQPPQSDAINVGSTARGDEPKPKRVDPTPPASNGAPEAQATWSEPRPPHTLTVSGKQRQIGLNYVIVQSYPNEEDANKARDALNQAGILCTVERGIPGWKSTWYMVVGIDGFDKVRTKEFEQYVDSINTVSAKFAGNSKFKKFEPQPKKWEGTK